MSRFGQLPSAVFQFSGELHSGFHPLLAETSLAAGLERSAIIAITASVAVSSLSLLVAYALPRARPDRQGSGAPGSCVPLAFAAMFVFLPLSLHLLGSNVVTAGAALILIYALAVLPVCISQVRGSLNRIPPDVEVAARIDGCSAGEFFRHVVLPIIAPNLVVAIVYALIVAWSLCVIAPSIPQIPASPALFPQANGFDSVAFSIAMAPLVTLFLILGVCLVRNARTSSQVRSP